MDATVVALVLLAALLHASWSALVKGGGDPFLDLVMVVGGYGVLTGAILPFLPLPDAAGWPFLAASSAVHSAYFALMVGAYRFGDLGHVYPLMRGAPPAIVALLSPLVVGESLGPWGWLGVALVSAGVLALGLRFGAAGLPSPRATAYALATAATIAAYTLVDGMGVRATGEPASFILWLFFLSALPLVTFAVATRGQALAAHLRRRWWVAPVGGGASYGSYALVLWAMTLGPIAAVAALRETSVVFATLIGVTILGEPMGRRRIAAAGVVATGAAVLRLA